MTIGDGTVLCLKTRSLGLKRILESIDELMCQQRKPALCICEAKGAAQLSGNCTADQHLCFLFIDGTIPLLPKSDMSSL